MNRRIRYELAAFKSALEFEKDHPLTTSIARLVTVKTELGNVVTSLRGYSTDQDGGNAVFRSGTSTREDAADALRKEMRPINEMAKNLTKEQFPGVRELFRMPRSGSYEALITRAESFLEAIGPIKAAFVDRGLPADFDEKLAEKLANVDTASDTRSSGKAEQVGGSAGMAAKAKAGVLLLGEMDSILSYQYRNDPALLAGWKSARHIQREPNPEEKEEGEQPSTAPLALAANSATADAKTAPTETGTGNGAPVPAGAEPPANGTNTVAAG